MAQNTWHRMAGVTKCSSSSVGKIQDSDNLRKREFISDLRKMRILSEPSVAPCQRVSL